MLWGEIVFLPSGGEYPQPLVPMYLFVTVKKCLFLRPEVLERTGMSDTTLYKIAILAERTGGWFTMTNKKDDPLGAIDPRMPEVCVLKEKMPGKR